MSIASMLAAAAAYCWGVAASSSTICPARPLESHADTAGLILLVLIAPSIGTVRSSHLRVGVWSALALIFVALMVSAVLILLGASLATLRVDCG
jgi:hypothetical protein